jgi:hypothetical protein
LLDDHSDDPRVNLTVGRINGFLQQHYAP